MTIERLFAKKEDYEKADEIINNVLDFYEDTKIRLDSRKQGYVRTRFIIIKLIREFTGLSLPEIANLIGYSNHTTVLHALKAANNAIETNDPLYKYYKALYRKFEKKYQSKIRVKYKRLNYCEI